MPKTVTSFAPCFLSWAIYFLKEWGVACGHVHGFNMDEWSDAQGNTLPPDNPGAFQFAMEQALYGPLGKRTVPPGQRHGTTNSAHVKIIQIAPTILALLGLNPGDLQAVRIEHTRVLPGLASRRTW